MCAKFANYYEVECWDPIMQKLNYNFTTKSLRGKHKLQRKSKLKLSKVLSFTCCYNMVLTLYKIVLIAFCLQMLVMDWHMV